MMVGRIHKIVSKIVRMRIHTQVERIECCRHCTRHSFPVSVHTVLFSDPNIDTKLATKLLEHQFGGFDANHGPVGVYTENIGV